MDFYYHELVLLVKKKNKTKKENHIQENIFIERFLSYHDA